MRAKNLYLVAIGISLLISVSSVQQIGKRVGPQFPFLHSSARLAGMGDPATAITDNFSGFGNNPSTLGLMKKSVVDYSSKRVQKGITFEHIGIAYKVTPEDALAFSFEFLHFGGTDFYTDGEVRNLGFEARTGFAYGRVISEGLSAGINIQAITSTTGTNSVWAFSGDIGFIYAPVKYIRFG